MHPATQTISARTFWLNYFGPTSQLSFLESDSPVWECTAEAEALTDGEICRYDSILEEGDFMVGTGGITLGMRPQKTGNEDFELVSTSLQDGFYTVVWRRSRYSPFDVDNVRVRYASAPTDVSSDEVDSVLGYKYHGAGNHFSAELALTADAASDSTDIEDGLIQHEMMDDGIILVGGSYGWNNPPLETIGYADIATTSGTILRFVYVGFHNVALFSSEDSLNGCDTSDAKVVGGNFESPFDLVLDESMVGDLFISSASQTAAAVLQCELGTRFKVSVAAKANSVEDGTSGSTVHASPSVAIYAFALLTFVIAPF